MGCAVLALGLTCLFVGAGLLAGCVIVTQGKRGYILHRRYRAELGAIVPYTGPLYNRHGREVSYV